MANNINSTPTRDSGDSETVAAKPSAPERNLEAATPRTDSARFPRLNCTRTTIEILVNGGR
jgi:hypothetical protein